MGKKSLLLLLLRCVFLTTWTQFFSRCACLIEKIYFHLLFIVALFFNWKDAPLWGCVCADENKCSHLEWWQCFPRLHWCTEGHIGGGGNAVSYDITTAVAVLILIFFSIPIFYFVSLIGRRFYSPAQTLLCALSVHDCLKARVLNDLYFNFILVARCSYLV